MKQTNKRRHGFTLLELLVSTSVATILMVGMGSSIYVASQTFETGDESPMQIAKTDDTLAQVMRDLQTATEFTELTETSAEFKVPDRDGDGYQDTIRYAWSGTPGDPLTYQLNGGTLDTIAENVESFKLDYLSRLIEGSEVSRSLLFVSGESSVEEDGDGCTSEELKAIELMRSWGFQLVAVSQSINTNDFNDYVAEADVVFISGECDPTIGSKINNLSVGLVCEQYLLSNPLGFGDGNQFDNDDKINITDNSHYITSGFDEDKNLKVFTEDRVLTGINDGSGYANDAQTLGKINGKNGDPSLVIFDIGDTDYNGREVNNRRVMLPWGISGNDPSLFTDDGEKIVKRSLEWAADGTAGGSSSQSLLSEPSQESNNWWSGWVN